MSVRSPSAADCHLAELFSKLVYCNPFTEQRIELERACLGGEFDADVPVPQPGSTMGRLDSNLRRLMEVAAGLMKRGQSRLMPSRAGSATERLAFRHVVHFYLFHKYAESFDSLISRIGRGKAVGRVAFYPRFREEALALGMAATEGAAAEEEVAHYFAFYFQLRRAWVYIHEFLVGGSPAIRRLRTRIWQSVFTHDMARYERSLVSRMGDIITLITGPSGSGKEVVARAVGLSRFIPFEASTGAFREEFNRSFFPLNLSALSPTLIESELFGHRKGAFTGALQDRAGYFEVCGEYGTVFLDEIGETDPLIQVKLLRVLQTRTFQRLGDTGERHFVGKVMAATNRNLPEEIRAGRFREDFYYRLCADRIETPPLAEILAGSDGELERLVRYVSARVAGPEEAPRLTGDAVSWIRQELGSHYGWPGNFRELEQCVRNVLVHGKYVPEMLEPAGAGSDVFSKGVAEGTLTAEELMAGYTARVYRRAGTYEETARRLEVDRRTVKKYLGMKGSGEFEK